MVIWAGLTHLTGAPSSISRCPLSQLEAGQLLGTAPGSLSPCLFSSSIRLAQAPSWRGSELSRELSMPRLWAYAQGASTTFSRWKQATKSVWGRRHGEFGGVFKFVVVSNPFPLLPILYQGFFTIKIHFETFFLFSLKSHVFLQDTLCYFPYTSSFFPRLHLHSILSVNKCFHQIDSFI